MALCVTRRWRGVVRRRLSMMGRTVGRKGQKRLHTNVRLTHSQWPFLHNIVQKYEIASNALSFYRSVIELAQDQYTGGPLLMCFFETLKKQPCNRRSN